jgi:hypothetical protein
MSTDSSTDPTADLRSELDAEGLGAGARSPWRLVVWNLDHARAKVHDAARVAAIDQSEADVIVLTETHDRVRPSGDDWTAVHSEPRPGSDSSERWVSLWVGPDVTVTAVIDTVDPRRTVAALLDHRGRQLLAYATVMPWHSDGGDDPADPPRANWSEHRRVVHQQVQEWHTLAARYPDASLLLLGDWNTDLTVGSGLSSHPYGLAVETAQLLDAAAELGLQIVTSRLPDPGSERDWLIDHVAIPACWSARARPRSIVVDTDHPLVLVEVD